MKLLKLTLSPKGNIVASCPKLARRLLAALKTKGLKSNLARDARDLGISNSTARTRPSKLVHNRFRKRKTKVSRMSKIAKVSRKARKLFSGSACASSTWGHQASGFSDTNVVQLERDALSCTAMKPAGRCKVMALLVAYGLLGIPRSRVIRETMTAWFWSPSVMRQRYPQKC